MIPEQSRYAAVEQSEHRLPDGRSVRFRQRRLPSQGRLLQSGEAVVVANERLDTIAGRELGNPELFWQLCDANRIMNPWSTELVPGSRLTLPLSAELDDEASDL